MRLFNLRRNPELFLAYRHRVRVIALLLLSGWALTGICHDARPVFIAISELPGNMVDISWKVPTSVPVFAVPFPKVPDECEATDEAVRGQTESEYILRQRYHCSRSLSSAVIGVTYPNNNPGLSTLIEVELASGERHTHILKPGESDWQVPERESFLNIAQQYTTLGIEHIFMGVDHLLFIVCLVVLASGIRRLLLTVTGFTLAHSVTLAISALDIVVLPTAIVEAAIALSIVFLAHEIILNDKHTWSWRFPVLVSAIFGLLHGFGFASVLRDIGLPQTQRLAGLTFFNVGVEIGQVLFIACLSLAFCVFLQPLENKQIVRSQVVTVVFYLIGGIAGYWFVERSLIALA